MSTQWTFAVFSQLLAVLSEVVFVVVDGLCMGLKGKAR